MSTDDELRSPLLGTSHSHSTRPLQNEDSHENTPLLSNGNNTPRYGGEDEQEQAPSPATSSLRSIQAGRSTSPSKKTRRPWPVIVAISVLVVVVILIVLGAFIAPAAVEEYAKQAVTIEPTNLSIDSFTSSGVKARVQADFKLDASKVKNHNVRNIGRFGTWLAHKVESKDSVVDVYLPEYGNLLLGSASVPPVVVNIRNGETTHVDFVVDLVAGEVEGIKRIANDWLDGKLGALRVQGKADVDLKSGILPLGTTSISESFVFEGKDIPSIPAYNITNLNFHEISLPNGRSGVGADASLLVFNEYPVRLSIPPLSFDILVPNCTPEEAHIVLADARTAAIDVQPKLDVKVAVSAIVTKISEQLMKPCSKSKASPLDSLLASYIHGEDVTVFVRGSKASSGDTPGWISDIMSGFVVPVPFPGHKFDDAIKNFTLEDVKFGFPDPFATPGSPDSDYRVSGNIEVLASMPAELNVNLNISQVRAQADVYYKGDKLGYLDLKKWQQAKSERFPATPERDATIMIQSQIRDAPLRITDSEVFQEMLGEYLIGGKTLMLAIKALVDIKVDTVLGEFVVRDLPGEGNVPVKAPQQGGMMSLLPKINNLDIVDTSASSLTLEATVNFTNPTPYAAFVRYANIHIENNGSTVGQATVSNITVVPGNNTNMLARAVWSPKALGGANGSAIGRELLSQYISGYNTTLTFRTHEGSIPSQPDLGRALSVFNITIPTPRMFTPPDHPDDDDDDPDGELDPSRPPAPRFIRDATFHLFSSTATFTLLSPLRRSSIFIEYINATAFYNHTEPIGRIFYDLPFEVHAGVSTTPKLPVDWSLDSVGYDKLRKALGGNLKLDAEAEVRVRLGHWSEQVWYKGGSIGAKVRI